MDYDQTDMAAIYDAGRSYSPRTLELWLQTLSSALGSSHFNQILDLGCGTGRYSAPLAARFDASVVGVDPSETMLKVARRKGGEGVRFVRGSGEDIPLADRAVDLVFISMAFHHFTDPKRAAQECYRVLREDGLLCVRAATSDRMDRYPHLRFFPETGQLLARNLKPFAFLKETLADAGFELACHRVVDSEVAESWDQFAEKIACRAYSTLQQLSEVEFVRGLAALREHAKAETSIGPVLEPIDLVVFRRI
jgi:ubiquinone/menaquinone biosynthesis C-methylase UbiE